MALSKSSKIVILLTLDSIFFLLELVVGSAVNSLTLIADSFHMLNDVISLCVGLWAVKVASSNKVSKNYTYGWQRAETLGALINGVFLVALCFSIFLEAIERLVKPRAVSQPVMVLVVGSLGLLANIAGLLLFHDHGHGHAHGHEHKEADPETANMIDESASVADVLPQSHVIGEPISSPRRTSENRERRSNSSSSKITRHFRQASGSRSRNFASPDDIKVHPASFRNDIIRTADFNDNDSSTASEPEETVIEDERSPLLKPTTPMTDHREHKHSKPKTEAGGHSHHDLNMRGVFLHVMGDALGNIGVIGSALFIWLTDYSWRFYADPVISLVITVIILASAIPLCKAASKILLQAVPNGLSVDDVKNDIEQIPGIISCHHLHVWQLSGTKFVATLHVRLNFDPQEPGSMLYMDVARAVQDCLHGYGIHSSTIQPEFIKEDSIDDATTLKGKSVNGSESSGTSGPKRACLLQCPEDCEDDAACCDGQTNGNGN